MITEKDIMPLAYFKKEAFSGSSEGMRYRIESFKDENEKMGLKVTVWPQPFSYECTDEDKKVCVTLDFDEEGRKGILPWLIKQYEDRRELYEKAAKDNGLR